MKANEKVFSFWYVAGRIQEVSVNKSRPILMLQQTPI
jgi:hypothetical protein